MPSQKKAIFRFKFIPAAVTEKKTQHLRNTTLGKSNECTFKFQIPRFSGQINCCWMIFNKSMCTLKMNYCPVRNGKFLLKTTSCATSITADSRLMI